MPLNAHDESACRILQSLDHPIGGEGHGPQLASGTPYRLMRITVYLEFVTLGKSPEKTIWNQPDHMSGRPFRVLIIPVVDLTARYNRRNVLNKRSPAVHVQALDSKANPQQGQVLLLRVL